MTAGSSSIQHRVSAEEIDLARTRFDIIARDIALKRKGSEWIALCPFHSEKTPSFYVSPAKGFFHCFGCSAHGTAIDYVMRARGLSFVDAVHEINGTSPQAARQDVPEARQARDDQVSDSDAIAAILRGCGPIVPGTAAYLYLLTRYLSTSQPGLLSHPTLACWELGRNAAGTVRTLPALVAPFTDSTGQITALQRIWLSEVAIFGDPDQPHDNRAQLKTRKKTSGRLGDGAIRLVPLEQVRTRLGLAEGIETADAARTLYRRPVWACGGTARLGFPGHWRERHTAPGARPNLWVRPNISAGWPDHPPGDDFVWVNPRPPSVWIPPGVEDIAVYGDNGDTGWYAAEHAAAYWRGQGYRAEAVFPPEGFSDFNDSLIAAVDRREVVVRP